MRKVLEKLIETTVKTDFHFRPELFLRNTFHSVGVLRARDHLKQRNKVFLYMVPISDH